MANKTTTVTAQVNKANELRKQLQALEAGIRAEQEKSDKVNKAKVEQLPAMFDLDKGDYAGVIGIIRRIGQVHGRRTTVTDEMRKTVKEMVQSGSTGQEIADKVGVSAPTVAAIKKALGLTKPRAATATAGK